MKTCLKLSLLVIVFFLLLSCSSIQLQKYIKINNSDFPMFGVNPSRTNFYDSDINSPLEKFWEYDADAGFSKYSAVIADSILFLPTLYGELHLINIFTGKRIAKQKFTAPISGSIAIDDNVVFLTFSNSKTSLICYALIEGKVKWELKIGDIESAPLLYEKKLFISNLDGKLFSIDKNNGIINWSFTPENKIIKASYSSPATNGKVVIYGCDDGNLYAVDFDNGKLKWKFKTNGSIKSNPSINEGAVYFGSQDGYFYCLNIENGELLWKYNFQYPLYNSQALSDSFLYMSTPDGFLRCLNAFSGKEIWKFFSGSLSGYAPLAVKNYIIIGAYNKNIYVIDSKTGNLYWSYQLNGRIKSSPIYWKKFLIVMTDNQTVYCFVTKNEN